MSQTDVSENLYIEYSEKVKRYVSGKVVNRQDAEDIVSEVFLKVYKSFDTFDGKKSSVSTWIYTVTRNTVTDYYRRQRPAAELTETYFENASVEDNMLRKETLSELTEALRVLDERSRYIIILRYYRGQSLKVIADRLDISYAYVKMLHNSALAELKKRLIQ